MTAPDALTCLALLGKHMLIPGVQRWERDGKSWLVAHRWAPSVSDSDRGFEVDTADCTIFLVTHVGCPTPAAVDVPLLTSLLDDSLDAISEVLTWERVHEVVQEGSAFLRQVGRVDVKFFSLAGPAGSLAAWMNPAFWAAPDALQAMSGLMGDMIMVNGVASAPLPAEARRFVASVDLINLGFYTEAVITAFALCDDMIQRVVRGGMERKGLTASDRDALMRVIKEQRLETFVSRLMKLCDWPGLDEADPDLFAELLGVNTLRNRMMHGSSRLRRREAIEALTTLGAVLVWLTRNPFGVAVAPMPRLALASAGFKIFDAAPGEADA